MDLALFDFDGTITTGETFGAFIAESVSPLRHALGRVLLAPAIVSYRAGLVGGIATRARVVAFAYRGAEAAVVGDAGLRFAREVVPGLVRPEAANRIEWHRQRGDRVIVVSGALDAYLAPWCDDHDLELLCSRLEATDGVLTGRYAGPQCVGAEKVARVRAHVDLEDFAHVWAYGDTPEDDAMLELATRPYYRWERRYAA